MKSKSETNKRQTRANHSDSSALSSS